MKSIIQIVLEKLIAQKNI